jgi:hypothetical protein
MRAKSCTEVVANEEERPFGRARSGQSVRQMRCLT